MTEILGKISLHLALASAAMKNALHYSRGNTAMDIKECQRWRDKCKLHLQQAEQLDASL